MCSKHCAQREERNLFFIQIFLIRFLNLKKVLIYLVCVLKLVTNRSEFKRRKIWLRKAK